MPGSFEDQRSNGRIVRGNPCADLQAVDRFPLHQPARMKQQRNIVEIIQSLICICNLHMQRSTILGRQFYAHLSVYSPLALVYVLKMAENNVNAIISSCTILDKSMGLVVILFAPLLGAVLYYFVRRPERIKAIGH